MSNPLGFCLWCAFCIAPLCVHYALAILATVKRKPLGVSVDVGGLACFDIGAHSKTARLVDICGNSNGVKCLGDLARSLIFGGTSALALVATATIYQMRVRNKIGTGCGNRHFLPSISFIQSAQVSPHGRTTRAFCRSVISFAQSWHFISCPPFFLDSSRSA